MGFIGPVRKPLPPRHRDRRGGHASRLLKSAYDGPRGPHGEPRQRPTGWALSRRRAVQEKRLARLPGIVGIGISAVIILVVGLSLQEMARDNSLAPLDSNRAAYERLVTLVREGHRDGSEVERLTESLNVSWIQVASDSAIVLRPRTGLETALVWTHPEHTKVGTSWPRRGWDYLDGYWYRVLVGQLGRNLK